MSKSLLLLSKVTKLKFLISLPNAPENARVFESVLIVYINPSS